MYASQIKPLLDFFLGFVLFIVFLPVISIVTVLLLIANRGHAFFIQSRAGMNEHPFPIIKFKTMNDKRDANGNLLPDSERITKIGNFVRKTSLDELPQLINILRGEMSLIGPRPLPLEYLPLYNEKQRLRHMVKPGITGLAQTNGRNTISWENKFNLDVEYVNNISFKQDIKILTITIRQVLFREGINASENMTMERFVGNN